MPQVSFLFINFVFILWLRFLSISFIEIYKMAKEKVKHIDDEGIPADPSVWNSSQVFQWMVWVGKEFGFEASTIKNYDIDGEALSLMSEEDFNKRFTYGTILWTHLQMLRKLALLPENPNSLSSKKKNVQYHSNSLLNPMEQQIGAEESNLRFKKINTDAIRSSPPSTGGGQIKLWQFLLELLTDADCTDYIRWLGNDGEFKFYNPEIVARKWGERKNKPTMNYEKLSRALRYYYDGNMLSKVGGKRFVYKFVCDLKELLGFSAMELNQQVLDCADRRSNLNQSNNGDEYLHTPSTNDLTLPTIHHGDQ